MLIPYSIVEFLKFRVSRFVFCMTYLLIQCYSDVEVGVMAVLVETVSG